MNERDRRISQFKSKYTIQFYRRTKALGGFPYIDTMDRLDRILATKSDDDIARLKHRIDVLRTEGVEKHAFDDICGFTTAFFEFNKGN